MKNYLYYHMNFHIGRGMELQGQGCVPSNDGASCDTGPMWNGES